MSLVSARAGAVCGARHSLLGLSRENWSLALTAPSDKAPALPPRGGFRRDPAVRPNFGRTHSGRSECSYHPPPLTRLCKVCTRTYCGPQNTPPPPTLGIPHSKRGQRSQKGTLRRGEPPPARAQNVRIRECSRPEGCRPVAPPPPRLRDRSDTHRCGTPGEAGSRGPVPPRLCTRPGGPQLLSAAVAGGS